jgi:hypothetical protein
MNSTIEAKDNGGSANDEFGMTGKTMSQSCGTATAYNSWGIWGIGDIEHLVGIEDEHVARLEPIWLSVVTGRRTEDPHGGYGPNYASGSNEI